MIEQNIFECYEIMKNREGNKTLGLGNGKCVSMMKVTIENKDYYLVHNGLSGNIELNFKDKSLIMRSTTCVMDQQPLSYSALRINPIKFLGFSVMSCINEDEPYIVRDAGEIVQIDSTVVEKYFSRNYKSDNPKYLYMLKLDEKLTNHIDVKEYPHKLSFVLSCKYDGDIVWQNNMRGKYNKDTNIIYTNEANHVIAGIIKAYEEIEKLKNRDVAEAANRKRRDITLRIHEFLKNKSIEEIEKIESMLI